MTSAPAPTAARNAAILVDKSASRHGGVFGPLMQRVYMKRHGKAVNVVFLDNHAETVPLSGLWQLKWSLKFKPRFVNTSG